MEHGNKWIESQKEASTPLSQRKTFSERSRRDNLSKHQQVPMFVPQSLRATYFADA